MTDAHGKDNEHSRWVLELRGVAPVKRWTFPIDLRLGPGVHALVGGHDDGLLALAPLAGGLTRPFRGTVRVGGHDPHKSPAIRERIGSTLVSAVLPPPRVVASLLAARKAFIESRPELRDLETALAHPTPVKPTVELLLALTTPDPLLVVLHEPFASAPPSARDALTRALGALAGRGATVIVATGSVADAVSAGGYVHRFEKGRIVASAEAARIDTLLPGYGIELRVEADPARWLVAKLGADAAVASLDFEDGPSGGAVRVRGADLGALGLAIARAAIAANVKVRSIAPGVPTLDELRAAAQGHREGAYQGAYRAAYEIANRAAWTSQGGNTA